MGVGNVSAGELPSGRRAPSGDGPVDPRIGRTDATVIAAVHRLLRTEGPEAVTFGRVSRETGVSRTTLYRHWPGPSALLADAWGRVVERPAPACSGDLRADLVALFLVVRDTVESDTMRRSLPSLLAAAQRDPIISDLHARFVSDRRRPIVDRLAVARDVGDLPADCDLDLVVDLLSGPLFYRELLRRERTSDERVALLVDAVLTVARGG
jgi:AcrR family transcriptional regulator